MGLKEFNTRTDDLMWPYLDFRLELGFLKISTEIVAKVLTRDWACLEFDLVCLRIILGKWMWQFGLYYPERRWLFYAKRKGWIDQHSSRTVAVTPTKSWHSEPIVKEES